MQMKLKLHLGLKTCQSLCTRLVGYLGSVHRRCFRHMPEAQVELPALELLQGSVPERHQELRWGQHQGLHPLLLAVPLELPTVLLPLVLSLRLVQHLVQLRWEVQLHLLLLGPQVLMRCQEGLQHLNKQQHQVLLSVISAL